eukprot:348229_1
MTPTIYDDVIGSKTERPDDPTVSYELVISENGDRDMKVLMATARGGSIVSEGWLVDSIVRNQWLSLAVLITNKLYRYECHFPKWDHCFKFRDSKFVALHDFSIYVQDIKNIPDFSVKQRDEEGKSTASDKADDEEDSSSSSDDDSEPPKKKR